MVIHNNNEVNCSTMLGVQGLSKLMLIPTYRLFSCGIFGMVKWCTTTSLPIHLFFLESEAGIH